MMCDAKASRYLKWPKRKPGFRKHVCCADTIQTVQYYSRQLMSSREVALPEECFTATHSEWQLEVLTLRL